MPTIRTGNGRSRSLRFSCGMTNKGHATATAKAKYRGLSAAAAECAAFGRDDVGLDGDGEVQATAKATADPLEIRYRSMHLRLVLKNWFRAVLA
jgi:hypothetical protein